MSVTKILICILDSFNFFVFLIRFRHFFNFTKNSTCCYFSIVLKKTSFSGFSYLLVATDLSLSANFKKLFEILAFHVSFILLCKLRARIRSTRRKKTTKP